MTSAHANSAPTASWSTLEPYAQLLRSLLPRTEDIWIFDAACQLRWTTESMTGPDLPMLVEASQQRARDDLALPGEVIAPDAEAAPIYLWWLRTDAGEMLSTVAVSMRRSGDAEPPPFSRVNALVRPAMECLRRELVSQTSLVDLAERLASRDKDMELLLSVSDGENTEPAAPADELKAMLQRAADHMGCVLTALIVPEKSIALMRAASGRQPDGSLLARTHRQLLNLMQTRREAVIINRVTSGSGHESMPYRILCCPLRHPNGRTTGALALFREASAAEFEARDARLIELLARKASASIEASYDSVTGLLTRPALEQRVIALASDASAPRLLSALYIDVDQLHAINENFGMHEGDGVLGQIGELLRRRLPAGGLAARISGDRFALLLPLAREHATEFAEALREAAAQLGSTHASTRLHVSISVGVASLERSHDGLAHALAAAETACKAAKDRGRNRVDVHEEADLSIIRRFTDITTAGELREAIASNRFRLDAQLIQPLGDASGSSHPPHFELLLRMIGTNGETVGPDRFLSAARRYQLMPAIDRWVVSQALEMLRPHAAQLAHRPVVFSINFSGQSLGDDEFADFLFKRIEGSGIPPGVLCFELTESDAVQNIARAEMLMRGLRRLGCGVALDDFGTGLSSLAYLRSLPATILKIDGSFVRDILRDPRSESMVQAIAQLARNIGIATVAEYAETPELVTRLTALGVDFGQGFAIGRPVPVVEVLDELPLYAAMTPLVSATIEESGPHAIAVNQ